VSGAPSTYTTLSAGRGSNTLSLPDPNTSATLSIPGHASAGAGQWVFANGVPLAFSGVEALNDAGTPTIIQDAAFLSHAYQDLLGRSVDFGGFRSWSSQLNAGLLTRTQFAQAVLNGTEYLSNLVKGYYWKYLQHAGDTAGISYWVNRLQTDLTVEQVQEAFVNSTGYHAYSSTNTDFVQAVYLDVLGRAGSPSEVAWWTNTYLASHTRSDLVTAFFSSTEYFTNLVKGYYQQYLHRAADTDGLNS
jgi:hypothetical protein